MDVRTLLIAALAAGLLFGAAVVAVTPSRAAVGSAIAGEARADTANPASNPARSALRLAPNASWVDAAAGHRSAP